MLPLEAEELLTWLATERGRSANTLAAYRRDLTGYTAWLAGHGTSIVAVTPADLDRFVGERRASGAAPASVARQLAAIRMLHRFMATEGHRADDPTADIDGVKVPAGIPKPLSEEEVAALLAAPLGDAPIARRDRALLELLYATGARISEMSGLDLDDLDSAGGPRPPVRQGVEGAHRAVRTARRSGARRLARCRRPSLRGPRAVGPPR